MQSAQGAVKERTEGSDWSCFTPQLISHHSAAQLPPILPHSGWVQGLERRAKSRRQWNRKRRSKAGEPRQLKTASMLRPGLDGSRFLQWICERTSFSSTELEDVPAQGWGPPVFLLQPNHWKDSSCPGHPRFHLSPRHWGWKMTAHLSSPPLQKLRKNINERILCPTPLGIYPAPPLVS